MNHNYIIREVEEEDFETYMNLMFEFTNYKYEITKESFCEKLNNMKKNNYNKIILLYSSDNNELMGCGTIIKLEKLHNNPIGQIEDVIVSEKYRGLGLGKSIIEKLVNIGLNEFKCYKIISNCLDKNIGFYKKIGFDIVGVEMKYSIY
jgi:glucosamine-phosphate N-acetyltransferase